MKGIRRAAAVCLTMTLAVSTLFGNTAWADMPQKTERKKWLYVKCWGARCDAPAPTLTLELFLCFSINVIYLGMTNKPLC